MSGKATVVNSKAEDLFVQLFCETFGVHNANNLYVQYPFVDIYGGIVILILHWRMRR